MPKRRPLRELVNETEPGWPIVQAIVADARNAIEVLPVERARGEAALLALQVTTRSPMGAIAYGSGGLLVDHGWIRVLGGGHARLPRDLGSWNFEPEPRMEGAIVVADDAIGGFFALNGGAFSGAPGNVFYLPPDTLAWEDLERGYTDFLHFLAQGDLEKFYAGQRWRTWKDDAQGLPGDRAYSIFPFLWAKEGGTIDTRSRKSVPIEELWHLHALELPKQLG